MSNSKKSDYEFKLFESTTKKARHVRITLNMMDSKAWEGLTCHAKVLYLEMKKKYNGTNEENISFTYDEGKKIMAKSTFTNSIDCLIEHGFIHLVQQGGLYKKCTIYGFSSEWRYFGTTAFKIDKRIKGINPKSNVKTESEVRNDP